MMRLLITGGCGFIGSFVVRKAIEQGHHVINLDALTYAANPANLADLEGRADYDFTKVDIRDADAVTQAFQTYDPDCVMHLAAESHVDRSIEGPADFIETNVVGTLNLLQAARQHYAGLSPTRQAQFKFHHISTDEVYGDLDVDNPAFTETTAYDPSSPYSASKASSDHLVRAWHRTFGLPVVLTNCSNNYGPMQFPEKLIPVVILKALHSDPIPVYGTGENIRDWLYVEDHAEALLLVLTNGKSGRTYNIGGNNERTNIELVRTLCAIMDTHSPTGRKDHAELITYVKDRPGHDRRYAVNADRIRDELGWTPSVSWNEGFEQTALWYLQNEDWWRPLVKSGQFGQRLGEDDA
ncbi:dTDP-glucose 4,6-dehydratase [Algimonas arctica]|uniref:dTDP-glucose 4,6-dehydratase n=2 Tax=Algimonas arctica TaxID=1479486 RepID=A0A8J3CM57_9PROT|nr:dTDP-glucose 4,6-dehydratase [Algimonas arctica]GHA85449.1 dTDP-glucose 4,6-dehydratase [Algimonas arctica]